MAKYKACRPLFAKCTTNSLADSLSITENTNFMGKMVDVDVKPNFAEATLMADDDVAETAKEFTNADVTVTIDELNDENFKLMYVTSEGTAMASVKSIIENANSTPNYGTFSYIYGKMKNGVVRYCVVLLHRVMFDPIEDKATTKGENITFETTQLTGKAYPDKNGQWRTRVNNLTLATAQAIQLNLSKRDASTIGTNGADGETVPIDEDSVTTE